MKRGGLKEGRKNKGTQRSKAIPEAEILSTLISRIARWNTVSTAKGNKIMCTVYPKKKKGKLNENIKIPSESVMEILR